MDNQNHCMSIKQARLIVKRSIVRRTALFDEVKARLSSVKKRSIVRSTVQSMFGELTVRPIKSGIKHCNLLTNSTTFLPMTNR